MSQNKKTIVLITFKCDAIYTFLIYGILNMLNHSIEYILDVFLNIYKFLSLNFLY